MKVPLVKLWLNPLNLQSYEFLSNFGAYIRHFGKLINFVPVYRFSDRVKEAAFHHQKLAKAHTLAQNCYGAGSFCSNGIVNNLRLTHPLKVLDQGIKQTCLFNFNINRYLDFIPLYKEECLEPIKNKNFDIDLCGDSIMKQVLRKEDFKNKIVDCYEKSFDRPKSGKFGSSNAILSQSARAYSPASSPVIPSFIIMDYPFKVKLVQLNSL